MYFSLVRTWMHGGPGPWLAEIRQDLPGVELLGDFPLGLSLLEERPIHPADNLQFLFWPRDQHDAVCLQALVFATLERALGFDQLGRSACGAGQSRRCRPA